MNRKILIQPFILLLNSCGYYYTSPTNPYYYQNLTQSVQTQSCTCKNNNSSNFNNNLNTSNTSTNKNNSNLINNNSNTNSTNNDSNPVDTDEKANNKIQQNTTDKLTQTILKNMIKADENNKVYEATFTNYSKGRMKNGKDTGQTREVIIKARMTLKKPATVKMNVMESPEAMARGSTLLYTGGEKVKVRAGGLLSIIPVNFDVKDPMFENARGHTIMSSFDGIKRLLLKETKLELLGTSNIGDKKIYLLKAIPPEKLDPEITHEVYSVDSKSFIVLSVEMFVNKDMVFQYKVEDIKTNINISDDFFTL